MADPWAYLNGQIMPLEKAALPIYDAGLVYGATVADRVRSFKQELYRLQDHIARFRQGCGLAKIPLQVDDTDLSSIAQELVRRHSVGESKTKECGLVMLATPGPVAGLAPGSEKDSDSGPTLVLHTADLNCSRYARFFADGIDLVTTDVEALSPATINPHIKHRSRLHWHLAEYEASQKRRGAIPILLDREGFLTETAFANFLVVINGEVVSPPINSILEGISLRVVRELCAELAIPFTERQLKLADCYAAQEAFLCGTSFCMAGVRRLEDITFGWPGVVTERILSRWSAQVGVDIRAQILSGQ